MILSLIGFAVLLLLAFIGIPLGFALILVGTLGFAIARADLIGQALIWGAMAGWTTTPAPSTPPSPWPDSRCSMSRPTTA